MNPPSFANRSLLMPIELASARIDYTKKAPSVIGIMWPEAVKDK
jgi:hypothetical protein